MRFDKRKKIKEKKQEEGQVSLVATLGVNKGEMKLSHR